MLHDVYKKQSKLNHWDQQSYRIPIVIVVLEAPWYQYLV